MIKVTIMASSSCNYFFEENEWTEEEAIQQARDWFDERKINVELEHITPCQVDGKCPNQSTNIDCSECAKRHKA